MNLRYRVLFANDGYIEDENLQKVVDMANLGNTNSHLIEYYGGKIKKNTFKETGFNEFTYLNTISRVAQYNAICNLVQDAAHDSSNNQSESLEVKLDLIYDLCDEFVRINSTHKMQFKRQTKEEIERIVQDVVKRDF